MKRLYSLKGRRSFKEIYSNGRKFRGKGIIIFVLRDNRGMTAEKQSKFRDVKIGISVTKKLGKAHKRNWIKRRIKSICNDLIDQMNDGISIIIKPGSGMGTMNFEDLRLDITGVFRKAGVINDSG